MNTKFVFWGMVFAGLAVAFGAFGAHLLQPYLVNTDLEFGKTPPMQVFQTAVQYQFFHAIALIITGILYRQRPTRHIKNAGLIFIISTILFSGSLYILTMGYATNNDFSFVGPLTPIGGIGFLIGWTLLAVTFSEKSSSRKS